MARTTLTHPALNTTFIGCEDQGVEQYFGIQYATLNNRFSEPVVRTKYDTETDATKPGPASFCAPGGFENEVELFIQNPSFSKPQLQYSDTECLNLTITMPAAQRGTDGAQKLPVFVWVHGGGFVVGSHSWPHYDHARLVRLAAENNLPMIGVGINYRLGLPGFLTSDELRAAGYKGNNFLRDQRAALEWVKKHIDGFGGDPNNVTILGESAGAMAITFHLYSQQPLFERAFVSGGTCLVRPALAPEAHEGIFQQALSALGLDDDSENDQKFSPEERLKALLETPMDEITAKLPPSIQPSAVVDNDLIHTTSTYATVSDPNDTSLASKKWLKALTIGDCAFDASVLYWMLNHVKPLAHRFPDSLRKTLAGYPKQAEEILQLYGFSSPPPSSSSTTADAVAAADTADTADTDELPFLNVLSFINDTSFYLSTLAFARGFSFGKSSSSSTSPPSSFKNTTKTNITFFNEPNPWPGKFQGRATHVLDVVFLFQNYNDQLSEAQQGAAKDYGLDFARFVSGVDIDDQNDGVVRVYGPSSSSSNSTTKTTIRKTVDDPLSSDCGRTTEIVRIADEVGWDNLAGVLGGFLMGNYV